MKDFNVKISKLRLMFDGLFSRAMKTEYVSVIICAGGSGVRMGGISKQLLEINSVPCIIYSLRKFQEKEYVNEIIISAKEKEIPEIKELCKKYNISKVKKVVAGGETRQRSVENAFNVISKKSTFLFIHDAARPCITSDDIDTLYMDAKRYGASTASTPCTDSIKKEKDGFIDSTIERSKIRLVQTPQVFKTDMYRVSLILAKKDGFEATDDNALVEHAGFKVRLSDTSRNNIKLTTPDDLVFIRNVLGKEEK